MPITTTKTFTDAQGNVYPYLLLNLAISPLLQGNDVGASVAMKLTPYRVADDGQIVQLPDSAESVVYLDAYHAAKENPALATAITSITDAIQLFVNQEGL